MFFATHTSKPQTKIESNDGKNEKNSKKTKSVNRESLMDRQTMKKGLIGKRK